MSKNKKPKPDTRQTGLAVEGSYTAPTGFMSTSPREIKARAAFANGMPFDRVCEAFGMSPAIVCKVLGLDPADIDPAEWTVGEGVAANAKDITRNDVRGNRPVERRANSLLSNPFARNNR